MIKRPRGKAGASWVFRVKDRLEEAGLKRRGDRWCLFPLRRPIAVSSSLSLGLKAELGDVLAGEFLSESAAHECAFRCGHQGGQPPAGGLWERVQA